jgi:hypothetical protein
VIDPGQLILAWHTPAHRILDYSAPQHGLLDAEPSQGSDSVRLPEVAGMGRWQWNPLYEYGEVTTVPLPRASGKLS